MSVKKIKSAARQYYGDSDYGANIILRSAHTKRNKCFFSFSEILKDISPFQGATDTPDLNFW